MDDKKENLKKMLDDELKGSHSVPALLFSSPFSKEEVLKTYEVLPAEPLHTIAGHIKNLYTEIQYHLSKDDKKIFLETVNASFGGKEAKRGCDYRLSLVDITQSFVKNNTIEEFRVILTTLLEIQQLLYGDECMRSSKSILKLYNLTFLHALEMKRLLHTPKSLTKRKLYGQYYHALVCHAPQQYRIMSLSSSNAEDEERSFNFLKTISAQTSNHHPANVIANAFIRLQVCILLIKYSFSQMDNYAIGYRSILVFSFQKQAVSTKSKVTRF
jgi:hypothetical protein